MATRSAPKGDYVAQEARNSALGSAGELLVMQYEEYRLRSAGKAGLADRIERVSESRGDGLCNKTGTDLFTRFRHQSFDTNESLSVRASSAENKYARF